MACKFLSHFLSPAITNLSFSFRLDDEEALRGKVDEALNVYDEYMKNKGTEGEATEPKAQEAPKEAATEENKS